MFRKPVRDLRSARAVYPGTFDPFTEGHRDLVERARRLFAHVTVLVAVNDAKRPTKPGAERALDIRAALPAGWENVTTAAWSGLTVAYCQQHGSGVIIRGVRNAGERDAGRHDRVHAGSAGAGDDLVDLGPRSGNLAAPAL